MGHNFYIYVPADAGAIQFIPWDLNEAFGGFGMGMTPQTQQQLSLLHPHAGQNRLIERVLATPPKGRLAQLAVARRRQRIELLVQRVEGVSGAR
jgi:hypothetical protein